MHHHAHEALQQAETLRDRWRLLAEADPHLRIRDAARQLGTAEAQLLATRCGDRAQRLTGHWPDLLALLHHMPEAMALTRNDSCVLEQTGPYPRVETFGAVGQGVGEAIDLRFFFKHWAKAFALSELMRGKLRHSLQFFDKSGEALHKIYWLDEDLASAHQFERLIAPFISKDQSIAEGVENATADSATPPDPSQRDAFLKAWSQMENPHDYAGLLAKFGLSRTRALEWAEGVHAVKLPVATFRQTLTAASESAVPVMIFVGNAGCLQIHAGTVKHLADRGPWFNVLDPHVNLHLMEPDVAACWRVRKPLGRDFVHALELYRADGLHILTLYGKRKGNDSELPQWREMLENVTGPLGGS